MMLTKIHATYLNGVLQPDVKLDLPEGATVELQISAVPSPSNALTWGQLAGIWSQLSEADLTNLETGLNRLRQSSTYKINQLARQLRERPEPNDD